MATPIDTRFHIFGVKEGERFRTIIPGKFCCNFNRLMSVM